MRFNYTVVILFIYLFFSCNKHDSVDPDHQGFGFSVNGSTYDWNPDFVSSSVEKGAMLIRGPRDGNNYDTIYQLSGWNKALDQNIYLSLGTKTLTVSTFAVRTDVNSQVIESGYVSNSIQYTPVVIGDSVEVTITKFANNRVSGFFKALMHDYPGQTTALEIKNGYFENVLIQ